MVLACLLSLHSTPVHPLVARFTTDLMKLCQVRFVHRLVPENSVDGKVLDGLEAFLLPPHTHRHTRIYKLY